MNESQPPFNRQQKLGELTNIRSSKIRPEGNFSYKKMQKCFDYGVSLKDKYPDEVLRKCRLFHLISGSTVTDADAPDFDLPEGEIENFIRNEL